MIDVNQFNDAPSVRKEIKGLTAKVARLNMAYKKAVGTDKEQARKALYDEAVADREALRKKLEELHAADKAAEPVDAAPAAEATEG
jgi:hypothetical protein